ncbi:MAG: HNH endonuclease [Alphaproteobacteria bacterium]|nr:HNH endonuclease [Alphaproteobacteria bacterium]
MFKKEVKRLYSISIKYGEYPPCALCGEPITDIRDFSFDHKIPASKGGKGTLENLQPSHKWCNRDRGNKYIKIEEYSIDNNYIVEITRREFGREYTVKITYFGNEIKFEGDHEILGQYESQRKRKNRHKTRNPRGR